MQGRAKSPAHLGITFSCTKPVMLNLWPRRPDEQHRVHLWAGSGHPWARSGCGAQHHPLPPPTHQDWVLRGQDCVLGHSSLCARIRSGKGEEGSPIPPTGVRYHSLLHPLVPGLGPRGGGQHHPWPALRVGIRYQIQCTGPRAPQWSRDLAVGEQSHSFPTAKFLKPRGAPWAGSHSACQTCPGG